MLSLGFNMPADRDERAQACEFSGYTEQEDW